MRTPTWRAALFGVAIAAGGGVLLGRWSGKTAPNSTDPGPSSPGSQRVGAASGAGPDGVKVPAAAVSQTADAHGVVDTITSTATPLDMGHLAPSTPVDVARLKAIESNDKASASELAELARGHLALARDEARVLAGVLRDAATVSDRATALGRLMKRARDGAIAVDVVEALALVPRADVADALDDLSQRSDVPEAARLFAERVVRLPAFTEKQTPELSLALALSRAEACNVVSSLVERAKAIGDDRAAPRLARFAREDGCGRDRKDDCYPCLRGSTALFEAREAVKTRPFVPSWILPK